MTAPTMVTMDGNEAAASVAYRLNEVIALYPITPSSAMGELCDEWAAKGATNIWGDTPVIAEMQSEGGAAGAVHGALQTGALATTFTASQGLLLMIPNMYKNAGELTAYCMHVAARTIATHALSIFGDHSDVMACRATGFAMLCSSSVQEAHDFACIGQAASLASRVPFLHFFDGFRTSHEVKKIRRLEDADLRAMINEDAVAAHRARALDPDRPVIRGTAQNPDTFFQAREACNRYYDACPGHVEDAMKRFAERTGRAYGLFDYAGHPEAERVLVIMGSGAETAQETVEHLAARGERVGVVKVRLYRPFAVEAFIEALPPTVRAIAVLDRTKEPGAPGEPLYLDVVAALAERGKANIRITGGRYGLSSKEFTPAMVKAVLDSLAADGDRAPRRFTVGINDDVTGLSLAVPDDFDIEDEDGVRAILYGLGSDGTVSASKSSIKIIGETTDLHVQGYFVYDSKKSGARTISHLRFGARPIRGSTLIRRAGFIACHQFGFLEKYDVLDAAEPGAVLLLNSPYGKEGTWNLLPREVQETIIGRRLRVFMIDAHRVAREAGIPGRINTVMQVCFFKLTNVIDFEAAMREIRADIEKAYGRKGDEVVRRNLAAVDRAAAELEELVIPDAVTAERGRPEPVPETAPDLVRRVTAMMLADRGDMLPVSAFPPDGTWATGTTQWEKRNIAEEIPIWEPEICIQCNKCALVCPHAAIRAKVYDGASLSGAPAAFRADDYNAKDLRGLKYTIQVAPEDCTGCNLCVVVCPAKDKANPRHKAINMRPHREHIEVERESFRFFEDVPPVARDRIVRLDAKGSQFLEPLFEFSGACAGCGETPYIKLLTQLFGDRLLIANATGCSSIYGGNLPTTPYRTNREGRGPAWSNSLFEDNAEFGFGFRLAVDQRVGRARALLRNLAPRLGEDLVAALLADDGASRIDMTARRALLATLRAQLAAIDDPAATALDAVADVLVPRSIWLVGGDGWAYDIGFGGLDHVLASGRDVNVLVLDTEVYSNTGGQQSKATPIGAAAKFAITGKEIHKKDLGLMAMSYGHVYVASVAFGANNNHTVKAFIEAESYPGPSLIIAYSHCIAHGYDMRFGADQQKRAVKSGVWPLFRFDPRRVAEGQPPLQIDSGPITGSVAEYMGNEARFRMVEKIDPQRFRRLAAAARQHTERRVDVYRQLAELHLKDGPGEPPPPPPDNTQAVATASTTGVDDGQDGAA